MGRDLDPWEKPDGPYIDTLRDMPGDWLSYEKRFPNGEVDRKAYLERRQKQIRDKNRRKARRELPAKVK